MTNSESSAEESGVQKLKDDITKEIHGKFL